MELHPSGGHRRPAGHGHHRLDHAGLLSESGQDRSAQGGMVSAEHLVVHPHEGIDAALVDDRHEIHSRRRRLARWEVCDLRHHERLDGVRYEAGGPQPRREVRRLVVGVELPLPRLSQRREPGDLRGDGRVSVRIGQVAPHHAGPALARGEDTDDLAVALDLETWPGLRVAADLVLEGGEYCMRVHAVSRPARLPRPEPRTGLPDVRSRRSRRPGRTRGGTRRPPC